MRWGSLEIEYARPLRWITTLYGKEVIHFALGEIISNNISFGHRQLAHKAFAIGHPSKYLDLLRKHWVLADVTERKRAILDTLDPQVISAEKVLPQVLNLVEYPFLIQGEFNAKYLTAPKEVLISEMVEHQRYFPMADKKEFYSPLSSSSRTTNRPT